MKHAAYGFVARTSELLVGAACTSTPTPYNTPNGAPLVGAPCRGVIGGTSAGASILASYLVRGAPEGNSIVMAAGHEQGFGFLRNAAVDQHVSARGRLDDLPLVLEKYPDVLGIGVDEGTGVVVQRDTFTVVGVGKVFVYGGRDRTDFGRVYRSSGAGDRYDLRRRRVVAPSAPPVTRHVTP